MPMDRKRAVLNGVEYSVTTLDGYSAVPVWHKVAKVFAPTLNAMNASVSAIRALGIVADGIDAEKLSKLDMQTIAMLGKLATAAGDVAIKAMDPVDLRYCIDAFAATTEVTLPSGKTPKLPTVFAEHFAGNLTSMAKWFHFCLEVNFGDFLDVLSAIGSSLRKQEPEADAAKTGTATSPSASPAASTP